MPVDLDIRRGPGGQILLKSNIPLPAHDSNVARVILARALANASKPALARRTNSGTWQMTTYSEFHAQVRSVSQWFIEHEAGGRTLVIVAENSPEVAVMYVAALAAGARVCPVGPNCAKANDDLVRLRHVIAKTDPAFVFVQRDEQVMRAVRSVGDARRIIIAEGLDGDVDYRELTATEPTGAVERSIDGLDVTLPACLMMTSGSSGLPKLVQLSLANLAANTAQGVAALGELAGWGEASLDWLPWHHAAGAAVLRASLMLGGTLYIDGGKPMPGAFDTTLDNLREISVPYFNNVPLGYAMLTDALERDAALRKAFFRRMRVMIYGGAGLPQSVKDRLQKLAIEETGRTIPVTTGYGATETVAGCLTIHFDCDAVGIGLPAPGVTVKLVPAGERYELRLHGPNIMAGYLDDSARTAAAFDEGGFYRTGDLVHFQDDDRPELGMVFAGRQTEEFKLSNGNWVSGGQLRGELLDVLPPEVKDIVLCDDDRPFLCLLVWIDGESSSDIMTNVVETLRLFNQTRSGASSSIHRIAPLMPYPDATRSEISDKGSLARRVILDNRPDLVSDLYAAHPPSYILSISIP